VSTTDDDETTDEQLRLALWMISSPIDGISEDEDFWYLAHLFGISKRKPEFRAGYVFDLSPESRLYKHWFDFPDLGKKGWAIIFRRWDRGSNPQHPGVSESYRGWVPPEREKEADHWIAFLNQEIRARLRASGQTPKEPDPAQGAIPPPAPPGPVPVPPLLPPMDLSKLFPAGLERQRQKQRARAMIDTIAFDEGDEFAPDAPWGAERLTLSSGGAFTYERRHRGSTEGCRGTVDLAVVRRIEELIAAAGFPQIPEHRLPPGASAVTLTVMAPDVEPTSLTFHRYFAAKVPGYRELVDALAGLNAALRSKDPAQIRAAGLTLE